MFEEFIKKIMSNIRLLFSKVRVDFCFGKNT